jgi:hypothetical protein
MPVRYLPDGVVGEKHDDGSGKDDSENDGPETRFLHV